MSANVKSSLVHIPSESDASPTTHSSHDSPEQMTEDDDQRSIATPVHLDQRARGFANELEPVEPLSRLPIERPIQSAEEQKMSNNPTEEIRPNPSTSMSNIAEDDRPGSGLPQLPPRNPYDHPIISSSYSQLPRSNQSIIRFMRLSSRWFLYGGTLSGIIVLLYQRYLFPSLEARTRALTALTALGVKLYTGCLERVGDIAKSYSGLLGKQTKEIEPQQTGISESDPAPVTKLEDETTAVSNDAPIPPSSEVQSKLQEHNQSINQSLARLADLLRQRELRKTTSSPFEERLKRHGIPVEPQGPQVITLHHTLKTFAEEMEAIRSSNSIHHSHFGTARHFSQFLPQFSDSQSGKPETVDRHQKVINEFKNEMRSLKGMLLNRRNFATWNPA
ncbi:uncharacterized protein MELLADRAFT_76221 [Melampsora larici-populina 98AG31]|uniref:Peroxin-14 n=1 Tax=Melampsora larici-populina (strain 98AG31 / pathotype 3-4-7) TaxID=747676 RepID=F4R341_MELLP|nr:uncharacterized protein MELLADRAFT_76221 [Melampsora larici-populina 98AG31]EGG13234.1 hypothetical protein MELLADRAFT_76221 [Melampsora larici-populina 98AG31]